MRADLHVHSTASDGAWTPEQLVHGAIRGGLDVIAIADHDTTIGVAPAQRAARASAITVVPAVELSTTWNGREIHVLGYFVDIECAALRSHGGEAAKARRSRMEAMLDRLGDAGIALEIDAVLAHAGPEGGVLGRPHLARAMVEAGHARTVDDAFDRFIGDGSPAFVPTALLDPAEGVELVRAAGGIAAWAHPPGDLVDPLLPRLVGAGLRGLEVYRPFASNRQVRRLESVAKSAGLLVTGGSDWHSPERNAPLGEFSPPAEKIAPLLKEGGLGAS